MSVRALDTFYLKSAKRLAVLCNRGLNGIDGTVSTAPVSYTHLDVYKRQAWCCWPWEPWASI